MSPKDLKVKHKLSYSKLAILLNRDSRTVERYCSGKFPEYLHTYCWLLDNFLESSGGTLPPTVWGNEIG